jgi:hypothetical protein
LEAPRLSLVDGDRRGVFASGLVGCGGAAAATPTLGAQQGERRVKVPGEDFFFLQLSDTYWGFKGPPNPHADVTLEHGKAQLTEVPFR